MTIIKFITYNILSQNLADLMVNHIYPSDIMNGTTRFEKIISYLRTQIESSTSVDTKTEPKPIICLQEVSEDWVVLFAKFFQSVSYNYINVQHGRVFNGNMGVLVAYPQSLNIIRSEFYNVGQHVMVTDENSKLAASKTNIAILLLVENLQTKTKFGITTYHMPCEPTIPQIALTHTKVLYKKIQRFMENHPWIWGGDFNMIPETRSYTYLTDVAKIGCIWKDKLGYYPLTNHAYIRDVEFKGCIDFVFYTKEFKPLNIQIDKIKNIIPDSIQPSDHIPIMVEFDLG